MRRQRCRENSGATVSRWFHSDRVAPTSVVIYRPTEERSPDASTVSFPRRTAGLRMNSTKQEACATHAPISSRASTWKSRLFPGVRAGHDPPHTATRRSVSLRYNERGRTANRTGSSAPTRFRIHGFKANAHPMNVAPANCTPFHLGLQSRNWIQLGSLKCRYARFNAGSAEHSRAHMRAGSRDLTGESSIRRCRILWGGRARTDERKRETPSRVLAFKVSLSL